MHTFFDIQRLQRYRYCSNISLLLNTSFMKILNVRKLNKTPIKEKKKAQSQQINETRDKPNLFLLEY